MLDALGQRNMRLTHAWVAYLYIADKYLGPLASHLRGVNQPVISTRSVFFTPRSILLGSI